MLATKFTPGRTLVDERFASGYQNDSSLHMGTTAHNQNWSDEVLEKSKKALKVLYSTPTLHYSILFPYKM